MSSTKTIISQARWRSWSARGIISLIALILGMAAMPQPADAGELEYQDCIRRYCTSYGRDEHGCVNLCVSELHGPNKTRPQTPVPVLYGAIAVETRTLITGYAKDYSSRADAERRAIAMCRRAGGLASGCRIAVWGHNSCLALSTSRASNGGANKWAYAWSDDSWVSQRNATAACRKDGGSNCRVAVKFCTG
jgi:serine/threonine-protein kinase